MMGVRSDVTNVGMLRILCPSYQKMILIGYRTLFLFIRSFGCHYVVDLHVTSVYRSY